MTEMMEEKGSSRSVASNGLTKQTRDFLDSWENKFLLYGLGFFRSLFLVYALPFLEREKDR